MAIECQKARYPQHKSQMSNPQQLVQKLWNYCNILRDDGLSYGDYVEQLTFLLFLKMADEQVHLRQSILQKAFTGQFA
jgi:type I restriction-modification system DNA methylase subunit